MGQSQHNGEPPSGDSSEPSIDRLCDAFGRAWISGRRPRIEDFLQRTSQSQRRELFEELLLEEVGLRRAAGESVTAGDFEGQFPEYADVVKTLLQDKRSTGDHTVTQRMVRRRLAEFELLQEIGRGAHGAVWKAHDTRLDRVVALKVPHGIETDPREADRVRREARAAAQLKHANIVGIFGVGEEGETTYLVEEYVSGVGLDEWIAARPIRFPEAAELCMKLAAGLDHAHAAGVVHRDLKPRNIIIDARGGPHITDFGLAKRSKGEETLTIEGSALGTPAYMSPEQANGEGHYADGRSDIYSLGVILYEMLTGERPFRGSTRMVIYQVLNEEPRAPRGLNDSIPRSLEAICLKAMAKEPNRRYLHARDVMDDLSRFLGGRPVSARPINLLSKVWLWCQRPDRIHDAGVFLSFMGIVLSIWTLWGFVALWSSKTVPDPTDRWEAEMQGTEFGKVLALWGAWECVWLVTVWIGWATIKKSRKATWCGLVVALACVVFDLLVLSGTYELGMGEMFAMHAGINPLLALLLILAFIATGANVVALIAHFSNPNAVRWLRNRPSPIAARIDSDALAEISVISTGESGGW